MSWLNKSNVLYIGQINTKLSVSPFIEQSSKQKQKTKQMTVHQSNLCVLGILTHTLVIIMVMQKDSSD